MAVDVSMMQRGRDSQAVGGQDARVMQRTVIIAGGALLVLVGLKLGFIQRIMP